jgi:hypothetical protein
LTGGSQTFATGTTGTDFNISSSGSIHTFHIPTASSTVRGLLSSSDWSTFNNKETALTFISPLSRSTNTISCPTCEVTGNKNAAGGYAGLTAGTKLNVAQGQEVWSVTDLTDYTGVSGSGPTAIKATITSPTTNDVLAWNGTNWINQAPSGGSNHNLLSATHPDTVAASPVLGDLLYGNSTPAWTKLGGNTTTTRKFLRQTGTGPASAAPVWDTLQSGDLPSHNHAAGDINSGQLAPARGGTGQDSSASSGVPKVASGTWSFNAHFGDLGAGGNPSPTGAWDFTSATSLKIPNSAGGPTIDAAGKIGMDNTADSINFNSGGGERVLSPIHSKSITVENPTASENISIFFTESALTVSKMVAVLSGSSTPSVTWSVRYSTDRSLSGAEIVTGGTTTTSTTAGSVVTSFNAASIAANSFIWLTTTAQSGTVNGLHLTIFYRLNP